PARHHRGHGAGVHLHEPCEFHRVRRAHRRAAGQAHGSVRQVRPGEGVGDGHDEVLAKQEDPPGPHRVRAR
ncbi:hypothetical protein RFX61_09510, partial [Acinetobacter baumannii]|nr:hypothetical protein [Acinetobacter baumannii]